MLKKETEKRLAIVYARVSSLGQKTDGDGLGSQGQRCAVYSRQQGYGEPVMTFNDSFTGAGDFMARPAMRALLKYVDDHPHQNFVVIFDDLKRFARDVEFHLKLRTAFRVRNILPKCLSFNFEDTPEGEYVETILAAGAQLDRKQNTRQVIQKHKARLDRGYWAFHAPRGYTMVKTENGNLCVQNEKGSFLKEALEGFAYKRFINQIDVVRFLQSKGFFSKKYPAERYLETIKSIIKNPFYAGYIEYLPWNVKRFKGQHEAIISDDIFYANQKRLSGEGKNSVVRQDMREEFALRGCVCCSVCGNPLTAYFSKSKTGKKHPYYSCQNKRCDLRSKTIQKQLIDDGFKNIVSDNVPKIDFIDILTQMFESVWNNEMSNIDRDNVGLSERRDNTENEIRQFADEMINTQNLIVKKQFEKRIEEKVKELETIDGILGRNLEYSIPYRTSYEKIIGMIKTPYKIWEKGTVKQKQELFYFMFDGKIRYDHKIGYRTPEKACIYKLFDQLMAGKTDYVEMEGVEPSSI